MLQRTHGSHRMFKHPTKSGTATIPSHPNQDMAPGTVHNTRKQAGLNVHTLVLSQKRQFDFWHTFPSPGALGMLARSQPVVGGEGDLRRGAGNGPGHGPRYAGSCDTAAPNGRPRLRRQPWSVGASCGLNR